MKLPFQSFLKLLKLGSFHAVRFEGISAEIWEGFVLISPLMHAYKKSVEHKILRSDVSEILGKQQYNWVMKRVRIHSKSKKVKCTLVQALRLCTGRTAHRGSKGIALPFLDHGTRRGWGVSVTPWPLFTPGKDPVPIVQEAEWAPGPVWTGAENLAPTGIRSPVRPASSQSLYRLRYPAH